MPAGWIIKQQSTAHCDKNTQMECQRTDVAIVDKCSEATFRLTRKDEAEFIEGVKVLKYLGRLLDRLEDDWPTVLQNIRKVWQVWGRLGKMLRREGTEPAILEKIYRAVIQTLLLLGAETCALSVPMVLRLEGVCVGFLRQVIKFKAKILRDGLWRNLAAYKVLQGAGTQPLRT